MPHCLQQLVSSVSKGRRLTQVCKSPGRGHFFSKKPRAAVTLSFAYLGLPVDSQLMSQAIFKKKWSAMGVRNQVGDLSQTSANPQVAAMRLAQSLLWQLLQKNQVKACQWAARVGQSNDSTRSEVRQRGMTRQFYLAELEKYLLTSWEYSYHSLCLHIPLRSKWPRSYKIVRLKLMFYYISSKSPQSRDSQAQLISLNDRSVARNQTSLALYRYYHKGNKEGRAQPKAHKRSISGSFTGVKGRALRIACCSLRAMALRQACIPGFPAKFSKKTAAYSAKSQFSIAVSMNWPNCSHQPHTVAIFSTSPSTTLVYQKHQSESESLAVSNCTTSISLQLSQDLLRHSTTIAPTWPRQLLRIASWNYLTESRLERQMKLPSSHGYFRIDSISCGNTLLYLARHILSYASSSMRLQIAYKLIFRESSELLSFQRRRRTTSLNTFLQAANSSNIEAFFISEKQPCLTEGCRVGELSNPIAAQQVNLSESAPRLFQSIYKHGMSRRGTSQQIRGASCSSKCLGIVSNLDKHRSTPQVLGRSLRSTCSKGASWSLSQTQGIISERIMKAEYLRTGLGQKRGSSNTRRSRSSERSDSYSSQKVSRVSNPSQSFDYYFNQEPGFAHFSPNQTHSGVISITTRFSSRSSGSRCDKIKMFSTYHFGPFLASKDQA